VAFDQAHAANLIIAGSHFEQRLSFLDALLDSLVVSAYGSGAATIKVGGPVSFNGRRCRTVQLVGVDFRGRVGFQAAEVTQILALHRISFAEDVDFEGSRLPRASGSLAFPDGAPPPAPPATSPAADTARGMSLLVHESDVPQLQTSASLEEFARKSNLLDTFTSRTAVTASGVLFDSVHFDRALYLRWPQLEERGKQKLVGASGLTWQESEQAFHRADNLAGQNESMYRRRRVYRNDEDHESYWGNVASEVVWGYGVRPLRPLAWLLAVTLTASASYWSQTRPLASGKSRRRGWLARVCFALRFGLQATYRPDFGWTHTRPPLFRTIAAVQFGVCALLLVCTLQAVANVSPLLNILIGKLIHF
jgi:hypothetical protein